MSDSAKEERDQKIHRSVKDVSPFRDNSLCCPEMHKYNDPQRHFSLSVC